MVKAIVGSASDAATAAARAGTSAAPSSSTIRGALDVPQGSTAARAATDPASLGGATKSIRTVEYQRAPSGELTGRVETVELKGKPVDYAGIGQGIRTAGVGVAYVGALAGGAIAISKILGSSPSLSECTGVCKETFSTGDPLETKEESEERTKLLQKCMSSCNDKFMSAGQGPAAALQGAMTDMAITMLKVFGPVLMIVLGVKFVYNKIGGG